MIGLAAARITATETVEAASYSPPYRPQYYRQRSSPMSIPSPLNPHGHLSPVDVDLDILTETDAEAIDGGAENSGFGDSVDLDDADLPGSGSDRGANGTACGTVRTQLSSSSATTTDSAVSSGTEAPSGVSSRRSSNNPFSDFKDYVRSRRQTVTSRVSEVFCRRRATN